ncbi:centromere protein P [Paramormyrops kingsleyae]|uniref:Centromere protein P n=1 Tax=Paramormyrops kingsleyae TaxID=1676925 RepID=A0A3B3QXJ2_9TELE|nr:centromere protein P [Paramormyrops kingsleyae]
MEEAYEAEIKLLQEEIAELQEHLENNEREVSLHFDKDIPKLLTCLRAKSTTGYGEGKMDTASNLVMELEKLEKDLARQTKMNGIVLTECRVKTLEKNKSKIIQQHRLTGYCCQLAFQVEFELTDVQENNGPRTVTSLNIVMDGSEFGEISTFVSQAEDSRSLVAFFRTLRRFSEWCEHRSRTFRHFQDKYPDVVSLPEGCRADIMTIQCPKLPGCTLCVVWSIKVTKEGGVTPKLEVLPRLPERALRMDQKKVMEKAPCSFQSLLRVLGVEAAIDSLIRAVCVD